LSFALGGWSGQIERRKGRQVDGSKEKWNLDMAAIKVGIQFVKATEEF
jgi:hypothetical protein